MLLRGFGVGAATGLLLLAACDEFDDGAVTYNYAPPVGYQLVSTSNGHTWRRIEGNRAFFREMGEYSGMDFGAYYLDYNCGNQTYSVDGGKRQKVRDLPPDSIGRYAYYEICRSR